MKFHRSYQPIGFFRCSQNELYQVPKQGVFNPNSKGWIEINSEFPPEAFQDLQGFERIWLIFDFHKNFSWKPKVRPPKASAKKRSVWATRSPHRPNHIGLSCVKLKNIKGHQIHIEHFDLIDGSPILDIKPYIPYADSFPEAPTGWLKEEHDFTFEIHLTKRAEEQIQWLDQKKPELHILLTLQTQLQIHPTHSKIKRVKKVPGTINTYEFASKTWRARFSLDRQKVTIHEINSGYKAHELRNFEDPHHDKEIHRQFIEKFKSNSFQNEG